MGKPGDVPSETRVRVLVVDDDSLVRSALRYMFADTPDIEVVAEAADGAEAAALADQHEPHVVLMDIRMPAVDGLAATEELRRRPSPPEVIMLTTFHTDEHVLRALRAGAAGFILKDTDPDDIVRTVRRVAAGEPVLAPTVTQQLIAHVTDSSQQAQRQKRAHGLLGRLNQREHEIALAIGQGKSNAEIATAVSMAVPTVKTHVSSILAKLELNNRLQIALLVHDAGLLDE